MLDDWAESENIEVGKDCVGLQLEVFVGDIPTTDDADCIVDDERLVVHTPIGTTEVPDKVKRMQPSSRNRVEKSDLDFWVPV